jgi:hypothetical protein
VKGSAVDCDDDELECLAMKVAELYGEALAEAYVRAMTAPARRSTASIRSGT